MKFNRLTVVFSALLFVFLAGCKTTKVEEPVPVEPEVQIHPLALLSDDLSIYMSVPVKQHKDLVVKILCAVMDGLSESSASSICDRTKILYSGLGTVKDRSHLETSAFASIPKIAVDAMMTKKNGFEKETVHFENSNLTKYYNETSGYEFAFPTSNILCLSQHVTPLLEKFDSRNEVADTPYNKWIIQESNDILFYITRPGQYLRSLIGQSINVSTDYIYGSLKYIENKKDPGQYSGKYNLSFYIHLTNKKAVTVLNALLSLSFKMMGGIVNQTDDFTLYLSNVEVTDRQIKDLFTRDPITGKHYKVVGEEVIEEKIKK